MGNPDLQRPPLTHAILQGPRRHLRWAGGAGGRRGAEGPAARHLGFPGGKLQRIFLDNGRKFHLGFFKSFFGNKRWTPMVLFKLLQLNISLCLRWPLTRKPGDASAGTQSSHPRPGTAILRVANSSMSARKWSLARTEAFFFWPIFFTHDFKGSLEGEMSKFADDTKLKWKVNAADWHQEVALYIQWKEPWPWREAELTLPLSLAPISKITLNRG